MESVRGIFVTECTGMPFQKLFFKGCKLGWYSGTFFFLLSVLRGDRILGHCMHSGTCFFRKIALVSCEQM
jgi:hypothetical protein